MHKSSTHADKDLEERYHKVQSELAEACKGAGRDAQDVCLVAVSKGHSFERIKQLYDLGHRDFGESYAQEFHEKFEAANAEGLAITWHFIGACQSNKLKLIKDAHYVHSIGSARIANILNEISTSPLKAFVQINLAGTASRQGVAYGDAVELVKELRGLEHINVRGLMAILPQNGAHTQSFWFHKMAALKDTMLAQGVMNQVSLSMGMSDDYVTAIHFGANFVRIGTRIFGPRA